ncbi:hypothetical protein HYT84_04790 [Candidatus Micrarchaeota archaeon]|nr:hypothetical protein [Candidatus Micrarchaeota archaeon]
MVFETPSKSNDFGGSLNDGSIGLIFALGNNFGQKLWSDAVRPPHWVSPRRLFMSSYRALRTYYALKESRRRDMIFER